MKRLIKLILFIMVLRYGGDLVRDMNVRLPSYEKVKAFAVHMGNALSNRLEAMGFQAP